MTVFSVDSDAVLSATASVRGTAERLQAEAQALMAQLSHLQTLWTGSASAAFQGAAERWRATAQQVELSLAEISGALGTAGRQYADAEAAAASLFR